MKELEVQKYLRSGKSPEMLLSDYAIKFKRHPKFDNLILFKYDQISSPFGEEIVRECRGIILDEANNWKVICHSFNKFFNNGERVGEAVMAIDWSTARVQEKVDGCFTHGSKLNCWDGSSFDIGEVVNQRLTPTLIGMDSNGNLVPCQVIDWFSNGTKDNWLQIETDLVYRNNNRKFLVTDNHSIFINGSFQPIVTAKIGDILSSHEDEISDSVIHMIESSLLGDGSLNKNGNHYKFAEGHKEAHKELCDELTNWLGECHSCTGNYVSGYGSNMIRIASIPNKIITSLRKKWYPNGIKVVPQSLDWMDNFTIAKWYMDDGSLSHTDLQQDRACFATNGFTESEVRRLSNRLTELYGVDCHVYNSKGWCLRVNAGRDNVINKMWDAIAPHIVSCMKYKLPARYRNVEYITYPKGKIVKKMTTCNITNITKIKAGSNKAIFPSGRVGYDIHTSTNNYMCNDILVHNSLMQLYSYVGEWHVASSGSPDAGGQVNDFGFTFAELFWRVFHASLANLPAQDGMCYFFELCSPYNRVVVTHKEESLTLLGGRDLINGHEMPVDMIAYKFPTLKHLREFSLTSWDAIKASHNLTRGIDQEGFVVIDQAFRRVKDKNPEYTALHHIKGSLSRRAFVEVARAGETSEVEVAFPEYSPLLQEIRGRWEVLVSEVEADYASLSSIESQRDFAMEAVKTRCSSALFSVRAKKSNNIRDFLREYRIDNVVTLLGYKADEPIPAMVVQSED